MATYQELRAKAHEISNRAKVKLDEIKDATPVEDAANIEREFDSMIAEADGLRSRADKLEKLEAAERAFTAADPRRPVADVRAERDERSGADYAKAFERAIRYGAGVLTSEERSALATGEIRDGQVVGTPNLGGNTVPVNLYNALIIAQKSYTPFADDSVCNVLRTDNGQVINYPTMDDTANIGYMIGEATAAPQTNIATGNIPLQAYKATTGLFKVSSELLQDSAIDFVKTIVDAAGERMGRLINVKCTLGAGATEPTGVLTALGANTVSTAVAKAVSFDDVLTLIHSVDPAYRGNAKVGFQFADSTLLALRKVKDAYGQYIWAPGATASDPGSILGYRYAINSNLGDAATTGNVAMLFGDWGKFTVRFSRALEMKRSDDLFMVTDQTALVGFMRFDSNLMDGRAIRGLKVS